MTGRQFGDELGLASYRARTRRRPFEGVIELRGILGEVVANIGIRIVGGEWAPGEAIPRENDLCQDLGVSRSVLREAQRILGAKGLIRSRTSSGTRVLPRNEWRLLDPDVMDWRVGAGDRETLLRDLLKLRLILEPGVVYQATISSSPEAREKVADAWKSLEPLFINSGSDWLQHRRQFIEADLRFHRALWSAVESELIEQLFTLVEAILRLLLDLQMRAHGSSPKLVEMEESLGLHRKLFQEFSGGNALRAEMATRILIESAIKDANRGMEMLADEARDAEYS